MRQQFSINVYYVSHLGTLIMIGTLRALRKYAKYQWKARGMALGYENKFKTEEEFYFYLDDDANLSNFLINDLRYTIQQACVVTDDDLVD